MIEWWKRSEIGASAPMGGIIVAEFSGLAETSQELLMGSIACAPLIFNPRKNKGPANGEPFENSS
jgi:hypothetical protein